mmetsp:Transcript_32121/g.55454  ORF Transcript_32121/g.55454 Transcript_32121/m.55454 type:complete len:475 (-) Transcript_32121:32-1456(-)
MAIHCTYCREPATLLCSCNYDYLCSNCILAHITANSDRVHCFQQAGKALPHYPVVLKAHAKHMAKVAIRAEIERLESYKRNYTEAINSRTDLVVRQISNAIEIKLAKLHSQVENAKRNAEEFVNLIQKEHTKKNCSEVNIFMRNCDRHRVLFDQIQLFNTSEAVITYEAQLKVYCDANLVFPSQMLRDLTQNTLGEVNTFSRQQRVSNDSSPDKERLVTLFNRRETLCRNSGGPYCHVITITPDREVFLTGILIGGGGSVATSCTLESLEVVMMGFSQGKILYSHPSEVLGFNKAEGTAKVAFYSAVRLLENTPHTIIARYQKDSAHWTFTGSLPSRCEGVTFSFSSTKLSSEDRLSHADSLGVNAISGFYYNFTGVNVSAQNWVSFKVKKPVMPGQVVVVAGSLPELGSWDPSRGLNLTWTAGDFWQADLYTSSPFIFKYVLVKYNSLCEWEGGLNRSVEEVRGNLNLNDEWH